MLGDVQILVEHAGATESREGKPWREMISSDSFLPPPRVWAEQACCLVVSPCWWVDIFQFLPFPRTTPFGSCRSRQGSQLHFSFGPWDFSCFLRSSAAYVKGRVLSFTQRAKELVKGRVLYSPTPRSSGNASPQFLNTPTCSPTLNLFRPKAPASSTWEEFQTGVGVLLTQ